MSSFMPSRASYARRACRPHYPLTTAIGLSFTVFFEIPAAWPACAPRSHRRRPARLHKPPQRAPRTRVHDLRHVLVRLGRLLHDELRARDANGDAAVRERVQHILVAQRAPAPPPRPFRSPPSPTSGTRAATRLDFARLEARPAPWHVLPNVLLIPCAAAVPPQAQLTPRGHLVLAHARAYARAHTLSVPVRTYEHVPIVPPISTGWPQNW